MQPLTQKEFWDRKHFHRKTLRPAAGPRAGTVRRFGKAILGSRVRYFEDYSSYRSHRLYEGLLPKGPNLRLLEVGSAPGRRLLEMHLRYGHEPFGVEFTEQGVAINREVFQRHGLPPDRIIHADFFDPSFQSARRESFDVVMSHGFIEHFDEPSRAIDLHLNLLKPGGTLVVSIPNKCGWNYHVARFFDSSFTEHHNLEIMALPKFRDLFPDTALRCLFCNYVGGFKWAMFNVQPDSWRHKLLMWLRWWQRPLNLLYRLFWGDRGWASPRLSPYLTYIGIKEFSERHAA